MHMHCIGCVCSQLSLPPNFHPTFYPLHFLFLSVRSLEANIYFLNSIWLKQSHASAITAI